MFVNPQRWLCQRLCHLSFVLPSRQFEFFIVERRNRSRTLLCPFVDQAPQVSLVARWCAAIHRFRQLIVAHDCCIRIDIDIQTCVQTKINVVDVMQFIETHYTPP